MKKRLIALFLVLAMTLSMVSCGIVKKEDNKADITALYQKLEDMQLKTSELTVDVDFSGDWIAETKMDNMKFTFKASVIVENENTAQADISYKIGDSTEFKKLTSVITANKVMYFDFGTLKTAAVDICNVLQISQAAAMISVLPPANYVKLDENTLKTLLAQAGQTDIKMPSFDMSNENEKQKIMNAASEYVLKLLQDTVKDVKPEVISGSSNNIKFSITKENISAICDAILAIDLDAKYEEMLKKMDEAGHVKDYTKPIVENKSKIIKAIKDTATKFKDEKDNYNAINADAEVTVDGEKGARKLTNKVSFNIADDKNKAVASFEVATGEAVAEGNAIVVPTDATDFMTYMYQLSALMQY